MKTSGTSLRAGPMKLVGGAKQPLSFIVFGLVSFGIAAVWLAFDSAALTQSFLAPKTLALVHLWLPGFLLSVSLGSGYQMMPVVLGVPIRAGERALWGRFVLHAVGSAALVSGFLLGRFDWVALGGGLLSAGALMYAASVIGCFARSDRRDAVAWSLPLSASWLALTVLLGIAMALNRRSAFLPIGVLDLLKAHAHLGLVGYFLTLLQGVTFQLVPMFTMGVLKKRGLVAGGVIATQIGLLLLAPGLAWRIEDLVAIGSTMIAAGVGMSGWALAATLASRKRKHLEPGVVAFAAGAIGIGCAATLGAALAIFDFDPSVGLKLISGYGALAIAGGLGMTVLGMLLKIVPFLVWMRVYGPLVGKKRVPLATELSKKSWERAWLWSHAFAVGSLALGAAVGAPWLGVFGSWLLAAGAGCFLRNAGRVLGHLGRGLEWEQEWEENMDTEEIERALSEVFDPEFGISVLDLGLIYSIEIEEGKVAISMTLTSEFCPAGEVIHDGVKAAVEALPGVVEAMVDFVWEPEWSPERISAKARKELGWEE